MQEVIKIQSVGSIYWINISRVECIRHLESGEVLLEFASGRVDYYRGEKRFLSFGCDRLIDIRSLFHQLEQLDKLRTSTINQIRQRLAFEFPEAARRTISLSVKLGYSPFLGWLAAIRTYTRVENDYRRSVARGLGIVISQYTSAHAAMCVDLELRARAIEQLEC